MHWKKRAHISVLPRETKTGVKQMTKKRKATAAVVALIIAVLGSTSVYGVLQAEKYKRDLQYGYLRSLNDLNDSVENIETVLNKAVYANTPTEQHGLAARLLQETSAAKSALAVLPVGDNSLDNISRFITQVGDFSMMLSRRIAAGQKISADEYKTMQNLESYSKKLSGGLQTMSLDFSTETFHDAIQETAKEFSNFPTLIYDGPFSDSVLQRKPVLTQGKTVLPQGNAQNTAAEFLGLSSSKLTHTQDTAGNLPTYNFTADGGAVRISVTKSGGYVADMANSRTSGEKNMDFEQASGKAKAFLESRGIRGMKESYYVIGDNICLINYAYFQDGILCYPDLIKVGVALDNGEIVRFQSTGYIMNHKSRSLSAKISASRAQKSVSPNLTVKQCRLALIPTPGFHEVLCYEFLCSGSKGDRVLVYINASTGYEEDILILQESDDGILTR